MAWDFSTDPEFDDTLAWIRDFVRDRIVPLEVAGLTEGELGEALRALRVEVRSAGLWAAAHSQVQLCLVHELLGHSLLAPAVFGLSEPDAGNAALLEVAIAATAREAQRDRWLAPLRDGQLRSAFAVTEPNAGSDPTLVITTAERDGDEWILNGQKSFVSGGAAAELLLVMAVTNPDVHPSQGASIIAVSADTPGVRVVREVQTIDQSGAEIRFDDVHVPYEHLVGDEGDGLALAEHRLTLSRLHAAMRWVGQAQRAFDMLCERSVSRFTHGSVLADKQTVQNWVADSKAAITAARLMGLHAAWKLDTFGADEAQVDIAMVKFVAGEMLHDVVDRAIQAHGALGVSEDLPLEQMYRAARAARIDDGPDEVHRISVARAVLKDYKPIEIPSEHIPTRRAGTE